MKPSRRKGSRITRYEEVGSSLWRCECDCGKELALTNFQLRRIYSCGCRKRKVQEEPQVEEVDIDLIEFEEIASSLDVTRQRAHDLFKEGLHRFKKHWTLWETVFETNLDEHPERAAAVLSSCRMLTKVLDLAEKRRSSLDSEAKLS